MQNNYHRLWATAVALLSFACLDGKVAFGQAGPYQNAKPYAVSVPATGIATGTLQGKPDNLTLYGDGYQYPGAEAVYKIPTTGPGTILAVGTMPSAHQAFMLDTSGSTGAVLRHTPGAYASGPFTGASLGIVGQSAEVVSQASGTTGGQQFYTSVGVTTTHGGTYYLSVEQGEANLNTPYGYLILPDCSPTINSIAQASGTTTDYFQLNDGIGIQPHGYAQGTNFQAYISTSTPIHNQKNNTITYSGSLPYYRIFIDFNRDGDFDDTHELIYTNTVNAYTTNDNFILTANNPVYLAAAGRQLRARLVATPAPSTTGACGTYPVADITDFIVNIVDDGPMPTATTDFRWVRSAGNASVDIFPAVSTAPDGSIYAAGHFMNPNVQSYDPTFTATGASTYGLWINGLPGKGTYLNDSISNPQAQQKGVVTRYGRDGSLKWAAELYASRFAEVNAVTTDKFGYVYACGSFVGTMQIRPATGAGQTFTSFNGSQDGYVAKFHPDGHLVFAFKFGAGGAERAYDVGVAPDQRFYVGGSFVGQMTMQGIGGTAITVNGRGNSDAFLAKFSDLGTMYWLIQAGGPGNDFAYGVSADKTGGGYLLGSYENTATFNSSLGGTTPISKTSVGGSDAFVLGVSVTGQLNWVTSMGGSTNDRVNDLAPDPRGSGVVAVGAFTSSITCGSTTLTSTGYYDAFAARLSNTGNVEWATKAGGFGQENSYGVRLDHNGNPWVALIFQEDLVSTYGGPAIPTRGDWDGAVIRLDAATGQMTPTSPFVQLGGVNRDFSVGIDTVDGGGCVVSGSFQLGAYFGRLGTFGNLGNTDAFVARYSAPAANITRQGMEGIVQSGNGIEVYPNPTAGQVYLRLTNADALSTIEVLDASGRLISSHQATAEELTAGYPIPGKREPGLYLIRCGGHTSRLLVQ